jgi:mobilization protein NikA
MAGSGTEKRKKGHVITARFDDAEAEAIRHMADKAGVSVGALLRHAVLNTPPPAASRRPSVNLQAVAQLLAEVARLRGDVGKAGGLLNQIAKYLHAGRPIDRLTNMLESALEELQVLIERDFPELRIELLRALGCEPDRRDSDDAGDDALRPAS